MELIILNLILAVIPIKYYLHREPPSQRSEVGLRTLFTYLVTIALGTALYESLMWVYPTIFGLHHFGSLLLTGPVLVGFTYLAFRYIVFGNYQAVKLWRGAQRAQHLIDFCVILIGGIFLYFLIASILVYGNSILLRDEWRIHWGYLFQFDLLESLFFKQNRHSIIVPSVFYLINLFVLDDRDLWLHVLSCILNLGVAGVFGYVLAHTLKKLDASVLEIMAGVIVVSLCVFWTAGVKMLFWGIGIHNYFCALGVAVTAMALQSERLMDSRKLNPRLLMLALFGAVIASLSFSTGLAVWGMIVVVLVLRSAPTWTILAALATGAVTIYSVFSLTPPNFALQDLNLVFGPGTILEFVMLFLGSPFIQILPGGANHPAVESIAIWTGALALVGVLGTSMLTFSLFRQTWIFTRKPINSNALIRIRHGVLFSTAIMWFVVGAGMLVGVGRISQFGIKIALALRFAGWPVLFWCATLGLALLVLTALWKETRWGRWILLSFKLGITVALVGYGIVMLNIHSYSPFGYNSVLRSALLLVVDVENRKEIGALWRPDKVDMIIEVAAYLKQEKKNIFAEPWSHHMGLALTDIGPVLDNRKCEGRLEIIPGFSTEKSHFVTGWAWSGEARTPLKTLYFVKADKVVGIGRPAIGAPMVKRTGYMVAAPAYVRGLSNLPPVFTTHLGFGHYLGYVSEAGGVDTLSDVEVYGITSKQDICRITQPIP